MSLQEWNERYRAGEQLFTAPSPLVTRFASPIAPGRALDLACGPGRHAIYLAEQGWQVTAVDGSSIAIAKLKERRPDLDARVADLERGEFRIEPESYDLICDCYYLQRDLFPAMQAGVRPGGLIIAIVHLAAEPTSKRARAGELRGFFDGWKILHDYEGVPSEDCHKHAVAEIVAQRT